MIPSNLKPEIEADNPLPTLTDCYFDIDNSIKGPYLEMDNRRHFGVLSCRTIHPTTFDAQGAVSEYDLLIDHNGTRAPWGVYRL